MARVKRATNAHKKRKVVLERASGYRGQRSRLYRKAKEQVLHSMTYAYRDRKDRKGNFRRLWIQRINAAARANGMTYNRFVQGLRVAGVEVDRRMLAELAVADEYAFAALVEVAKKALPEASARRPPGLSSGLTRHPGFAVGWKRAHQRALLRVKGRPQARRVGTRVNVNAWFLAEGPQAVGRHWRQAAGCGSCS